MELVPESDPEKTAISAEAHQVPVVVGEESAAEINPTIRIR
jgi:hypothetical protein